MIGKFYPLTPEMSNKMRKAKLTKHEMTLWLYLIEKDPFGDRYWQLPPTLEIIAELEMSKASYFRAKARLQELELFDFQEQRVDCRNLMGVSKMRLETQNSDSEQQKGDSESQKCSSKSQKCSSKSQERDSESPEPLPDNNSSPSQTIHTYSDFKKTLSEEQRASFLNFCHEKTKNLSQQVNDLEAWLAHQNKAGQNRWEVYYEKFQNNQRPKVKKSPSSALANKFEAELEQQRERALAALKNEAPTVPQPLKKAEIKVEPPQAFVIAMPKEEASGQDTAIAPPESKTDDSAIVIEENDLTEIAVAHSLTLELEHLAQESEPQFSLLASLVTENETYNLADNAFGNELPKVAYSPVETERDAVHQHSSKNVSPDCSRQQQDRAIATNKSQESATPTIYQHQQPDCAIATNENQESATPIIYESDTENISRFSNQEWLRGQL